MSNAKVSFPDDTSFFSPSSGAAFLYQSANVTFGDRLLFQVRAYAQLLLSP